MNLSLHNTSEVYQSAHYPNHRQVLLNVKLLNLGQTAGCQLMLPRVSTVSLLKLMWKHLKSRLHSLQINNVLIKGEDTLTSVYMNDQEQGFGLSRVLGQYLDMKRWKFFTQLNSILTFMALCPSHWKLISSGNATGRPKPKRSTANLQVCTKRNQTVGRMGLASFPLVCPWHRYGLSVALLLLYMTLFSFSAPSPISQ